MTNYQKYTQAIRNQERLEQLGWIPTIILPPEVKNGKVCPPKIAKRPVAGRKLNRRQERRFKYWGAIAAVNLFLHYRTFGTFLEN